MKTVNVAECRELDRKIMEETGISGKELMERAGRNAAAEIHKYLLEQGREHVKRIVCLAGKGNNGGDAYVIAATLQQRYGYENVTVFAVCPISELTEDARFHATELPTEIPVEIKKELQLTDFSGGDVIIDGLLGTGMKTPLREPYRSWIKTVNRTNLPVIAVDIPSGMDGNGGEATEDCVNADLTVGIALPKSAYISEIGRRFCGTIRMADIGIPGEYIDALGKRMELVTAADAAAVLPRLPADSHKNSMGRVLIVGGSAEYPGAPVLAAEAALRGGAGRVIIAMPKSAVPLTANRRNALIVRGLPENKGYFCRGSIKEALALSRDCDAMVLGPGLGQPSGIESFVEALCREAVPKVIDADALNVMAANPGQFFRLANAVLTPHPGEMRRLQQGFAIPVRDGAGRIEQAVELAAVFNAVVLLKGHRSVTAGPDGDVAVNGSGSPALATAGSGDCLSGLIAALLASGMEPVTAVKTAAFLHGLAGELSPLGRRGLIADDLPELIAVAMRQISPFA